MNPVRQLRMYVGATQSDFAQRVGTSQSTIAAYESGSKSPTLRTLHHMASRVGRELAVGFERPMTREDLRSLAFHEAIAQHILKHPDAVLQHARDNLVRLRTIHANAHAVLDRWADWLELRPNDLVARMLSKDEVARDMRQSSPFSGILTASERAAILRTFRERPDLEQPA